MKQALIVFFSILTYNTCVGQTQMMSFNIRYDNPNDGDNSWEFRKNEVVALLKYYKPDFIGLQESLPHQRDFISNKLPAYSYIGHGRDGLNTNSEGTPIFFNKNKFKLLESDIFWLSETPKQPSKGWDAALNRIIVYGVFKNKISGDTLHVFNCHFDHKGVLARENSAEQLVTYIKYNAILNEKIVVMGDFNCLPTDKPIKILSEYLKDSFSENTKGIHGPIGTFNEFDTERELTQRIDYIFVRNINVTNYRAINDKRENNLYPSDHLPILINF